MSKAVINRLRGEVMLCFRRVSLIILVSAITLCAQMYLKATVEPNRDLAGSSSLGIGCRLGRVSPHFSLGWCGQYRTYDNRGEVTYAGESRFVPKIGVDFILDSRLTEVYLPVRVGTNFWELIDSNSRVVVFSELGMGIQRRFEDAEIGGDVGVHYFVSSHDLAEDVNFTYHYYNQYVKVHLKYYF